MNLWTNVRLCREWRLYLAPTRGHLARCEECSACSDMQGHAGEPGHETCHPPYCARRADDPELNRVLAAQGKALHGREAALCMATGVGSGVVVLDFDRHGHADGVALFHALDAGRDPARPIPPTLMAATPQDGFHLFYRLPEGLEQMRGRNFPAEGWDLKGDGGHVKIPPTRKGEVGYHWETSEWGSRPPASIADLTEAPAWVIELGKRREIGRPETDDTPLDAKLAGIHRVVAGAAHGERDRKTYWAACRLAEMVQKGETTEKVALSALATAVALIPDQTGMEPDLAFRKWTAAVRTLSC